MSFAITVSQERFTYTDAIQITGDPAHVHYFDTVGFRSRGGTEYPWTASDAGTPTFHNDLALTNPGIIVGHYDDMVPPGDYDLVVIDSITGEMGSAPVTLYDPAVTRLAQYVRRSDGALSNTWNAEAPSGVQLQAQSTSTPRKAPTDFYFYWNDNAPPRNAQPAGASWGGYDERYSGSNLQQPGHYYRQAGSYQPVVFVHYNDDSWANIPIGAITLTGSPPPPPSQLTPPWYDSLTGEAQLTSSRVAFANPGARNG